MTEAVVILAVEQSVSTFFEALAITFGHLFFFGRPINVIENLGIILALTATSIIGIIIQGLALQWGLTKVEALVKKMKSREANRRVS